MTSSTNPPTILVIVGITGDLARRKLLPAIERLAAAGELPKQFQVLGITRRKVSRQEVVDSLPAHLGHGYPFISKQLRMLQLDLENGAEYQKLQSTLEDIDKTFGVHAQRLLYLSIPPQASQPVIELLGQAGFGKDKQVKLLLEKPFGSDLASATDLFEHISQYFDEDQLYHIDHYLAKEMAQNVLSFRASNPLLTRTWNKDFIEHIEVIAAEQIGIEGRVTFYEQTGALRDFLQSHLPHLAALVLMALPSQPGEVQPRRLAALQALHLPAPDSLARYVTRGQYKGYEQEVNNPHTRTETFASITLFSADEQWQGVPITLTTGKALKNKYTDIRIHYRRDNNQQANELKLRFHPREGIELTLWSKHPGRDRILEPMRLHFNYGTEDDAQSEAHEQVIFDAIHSDHSRFISSEEVLAAWRLLAPIQASWAVRTDDLLIYDKGSTPEEILSKEGKPKKLAF